MFDEPTAGMSVDEVPVMLDLIHADQSARSNKTILLVEHKMDVVRSLADRIIVLHNGALVADGEPAEVMASPIVQEAYLGTARRMPEAAPDPLRCRRPHAYRPVPHPARRRPGGAARRPDRAAGPQRRRQDHDPAHHHGPVARQRAARIRFDGARHHAAWPRPTSPTPASPTCPNRWRIFSDLTVRENLLLAARNGAARRSARVDWIFGFFPALKKFWHCPAGMLSGGQKQMLAIAPRHRRAAQAAAGRRADQGPGARHHPQPDRRLPRTEGARHHHPAGRAELQRRQVAGRHGRGDGRRPRRARRPMADLVADDQLQQRLLGLSLDAHQ